MSDPDPDDAELPADPGESSRRGVLAAGGSLFFAGTALVVGVPGARFLLTPVLERGEATEVDLGEASPLISATSPFELRFHFEGRVGYVSGRRSGLLLLVPDSEHEVGARAYSAVCTHKGCNVSWDMDEELFACPCHQGRFDLDGAPVAGPASEPLREIQLELREGHLWARLPEGAA